MKNICIYGLLFFISGWCCAVAMLESSTVVSLKERVSLCVTNQISFSYVVNGRLDGKPVLRACCVMPNTPVPPVNPGETVQVFSHDAMPLIGGIGCACIDEQMLAHRPEHKQVARMFFNYLLRSIYERGYRCARISSAIEERPACLASVYEEFITSIDREYRNHEHKIVFSLPES